MNNAIEELKAYTNTCDETDGMWRGTYLRIMDLIESIEDEYMELPKDCNGDVIHVGDKVNEGDLPYEVMGIQDSEYLVVRPLNGRGFGLRAAAVELVKPEQPDSMERIKADAIKDWYEYWVCPMANSFEYECTECKSKHDGEVPREQYDVPTCEMAVPLDLIARTEKLLGGEKQW